MKRIFLLLLIFISSSVIVAVFLYIYPRFPGVDRAEMIVVTAITGIVYSVYVILPAISRFIKRKRRSNL